MLELSGLFFSAIMSSTILPGTSEVYVISLINFADHSKYLILTIATLGNSIGSMITFYMGFFFRRYKPTSYKVNKLVVKYGEWSLLLSWMPLIGDVICIVAGYFKLNPIRSLLIIIFSKALRYIFIIEIFDFK